MLLNKRMNKKPWKKLPRTYVERLKSEENNNCKKKRKKGMSS